MVPHPHAERQPDRDVAQQALPWWALQRDSGFQNMRAKPPGQVRSECAILFSVLPRTDGRAQEEVRRSWFGWFSWD
jgi:hypothetical protein